MRRIRDEALGHYFFLAVGGGKLSPESTPVTSAGDFVEARPLSMTEALARLLVTLQRLHALPPFPVPRVVNYLDAVDGFVRRFQAAKILPESETEELVQLYASVASVYPRHDAVALYRHFV